MIFIPKNMNHIYHYKVRIETTEKGLLYKKHTTLIMKTNISRTPISGLQQPQQQQVMLSCRVYIVGRYNIC